jgi:hypothetical protein
MIMGVEKQFLSGKIVILKVFFIFFDCTKNFIGFFYGTPFVVVIVYVIYLYWSERSACASGWRCTRWWRT